MTLLLRLGGAVALDDRDGDVHHLASAHAQVALVRLTIERGAGTTRFELADTLWPDVLPSTWESALRSVVSRVRSFIATVVPNGSNPIAVRSGRYVLSLPDDVIVDVEEGEACVARARHALAAGDYESSLALATEAVSRLRSPLLADRDGDWINRTRERFADLHLDALETASVAALARDEHGDALMLANEAARIAPSRESAHRCRINAHAAAGNRAAALRAYYEVRKLLADEFGVDPCAETEAVYLEQLGTGSCSARRNPPPMSSRRPATFVGRADELATLDDRWTRAASGECSVALVSGETGIGKTRLVTEVARRAMADGGRTLCVRCDGSMTTAFAPFIDLIGGYVAGTPDDVLPRLTASSREALARACAPTAATPEDQPSIVALRTAFTELLGAAAGHVPLLVVLDDIHLADDHTVWLLRHIADVCATARLMILVTARSDGPRPPALISVVEELERDRRITRVELAGLEPVEALQLLRHESAGNAVARRRPLQQMLVDTAGNAFLLLELMQEQRVRRTVGGVPRTLPTAVSEYTRVRLSALGSAARDLLAAAAVSGDEFELDLAAAASGLDSSTAYVGLGELREFGLVTETVSPDPRQGPAVRHRFVHAVVRRVVYEQLGEVQRRMLHRRFADVIANQRADGIDCYLAELTDHRLAAGPDPGPGALQWACRVAARIHESGAPRDALRLYEDALRAVPSVEYGRRSEILAKLGRAQRETGHSDAAHTLLAATIEARRGERADVAIQAALDLAVVAETNGRFRDEALAVLDDLVAIQAGDALNTDISMDGFVHRHDALTRAHIDAHRVRLGGTVAPGSAAVGACALARDLASIDSLELLERRASVAQELRDLSIPAGDGLGGLVAAHHLAMVAEITTDRPAVTEAALATLVATRDADRTVVDALVTERVIATAVTEGRFTWAATAARRFQPVVEHDVLPLGGPPPGTMLNGQLLVSRCLQPLSASPSQAPPGDGAIHVVERSLIDLFTGARGKASFAVRSLVTGAEPMPVGDEWLHAVGLLGFAAVELADPMIAEALREVLAPVAHLTCCLGYRSYVGPVAFHLGRLDAMLGDWGEAERHLTVALRALGRRRAHPWIGLAESAMTRTLQARSQPPRGRRVDEPTVSMAAAS